MPDTPTPEGYKKYMMDLAVKLKDSKDREVYELASHFIHTAQLLEEKEKKIIDLEQEIECLVLCDKFSH